jgi:hypothetical protein
MANPIRAITNEIKQSQTIPTKKMMNAGADISKDKKYRFSLWRIWDESKDIVLFIGLNPSNADETNDDPTIKKLITLCGNWGVGGFYIANLFAFITSNPKELLNAGDPIGSLNDSKIQELSEKCSRTIFMWGNHGVLMNRNKIVSARFKSPYCIGITKKGNPIHPLYQNGHSELKEYNQSIFIPKKNEIKDMAANKALHADFQSITVYKINPNDQELNGEVTFDRNVDGRVFNNIKLRLVDHAITIENGSGEIEGVFSLHHYYFLKL